MIVACQVMDPGSNPGKRMFFACAVTHTFCVLQSIQSMGSTSQAMDLGCKSKKKSLQGLEPWISCSVGRRLIHWAIATCSSSLVVMMSALHAEGREFNPRLEYFFASCRHCSKKEDTHGGTWTRNPQIRSLVLYPLSHEGDVTNPKKMRRPGVEPGAKAWEASMLPIHHRRLLGQVQTKRGSAWL